MRSSQIRVVVIEDSRHCSATVRATSAPLRLQRWPCAEHITLLSIDTRSALLLPRPRLPPPPPAAASPPTAHWRRRPPPRSHRSRRHHRLPSSQSAAPASPAQRRGRAARRRQARPSKAAASGTTPALGSSRAAGTRRRHPCPFPHAARHRPRRASLRPRRLRQLPLPPVAMAARPPRSSAP